MRLEESMKNMVVLGTHKNQLYTMRYFFRVTVKFSGSSERDEEDHFLLNA